MLKIENLHVSYGGIKALRGISLEVPDGKIVTLIGANGAGKSTTLRTISGLVKADSGSITYNDQELLGRPINKVLEAGIAQSPEGRRVFANLTVLENVFVPWDRVFMCGETAFSGLLVERFACYHRANYGGCKSGVSDVVIGAAALMADYSGYGKASHIKEKLNEMIHKEETLFACSLACSCEGKCTASGAYFVDPLLANVGKHNVTQLIYEIDRLAQDIGGGIIATMPSESDLKNPKIGHYVDKYLRGVDCIPTEDRMRVGRLIENMTGGTALVESMHGAGSPQAQKVMYSKLSSLEQKKKYAAAIAGVGHGGKKE